MFILSKNFNKYDSYIFLLIASLVAGNLFGAFQVPRVLALLLVVPCLNGFSKVKKAIGEMKNWVLLFLLYSFASCAWNPAGVTEGMVGAIYNIVHVLLFFEIIIFSRFANNPIKSIVCGFLVAFAISAVIAFWELTTDQHLETSKMKEAKASNTGYEIYIRYFAAATFYNLNTYVMFICLLMPFLFYGIIDRQSGKVARIIFVVATAIAIILILYNGSRGGLLAFLIIAAVYMMFSGFRFKRFSGYVVFLTIIIAIVLYNYGSSILNTLLIRGEIQGGIEDEGRFVIWGNVIKVVQDYLFMGCGPEGLMYAMEHHAHGGTLASHNLFLEVLSEYGIIFFVLFLFYLFSLFKKINKIVDKQRKMCLYQALLSIPVVGIINSGYLTQPVLWASMASLYVFANYEQIRFTYKNIRTVA